jgi:putative ABC transport system permease protein
MRAVRRERFLIRLAATNLVRYPLRSAITVAGVCLGIAIILAVSLLNDSTREMLTRTVEELGSGPTDIWVEVSGEKTSSIGSRQERLEEGTIRRIAANPAVVSTHPVLELRVVGESQFSPTAADFYLFGVKLLGDRAVRNYLLSSGRFPENSRQAMVGARIADELRLSPGKWFGVRSPNGRLSLEVSGILAPEKGSGAMRNNRVVFADLEVIQEFFNADGEATGLNLVLAADVDPEQVADSISTMLPPNASAGTDPLMIAMKRDDSEQLRAALMLTSFLAILVGGFLIYNTLASLSQEIRREVALYRLAGMTPGQVARLVLYQAGAYALIGAVTGFGTGVLLGRGMIYLLKRIFVFQSFFLPPPSFASILIAVGTGTAVTLAAAILPSLKTAGTPPVAIFQDLQEDRSKAHPSSLCIIFGFACISAALLLGLLRLPGPAFAVIRLSSPVLLFLGLVLILPLVLPPLLRSVATPLRRLFGISGLLAAKSLVLRLGRTVVTVGAVSVALSIAVGTLVMMNSTKKTVSTWLDETRWADILLFSISGTEIEETVVQEVETYPFIAEVNPIRYYFVQHDHPALSDNGFLFQAVDPEHFASFTDLEIEEGNTAEAIDSLATCPAILINDGLARRLGTKQGDRLEVMTDMGMEELTIAGTVVDYSDFVHRMGKIVYGSFQTLKSYWGGTGYNVLQIRLASGFDENEAKKILLDGLASTYDIKILTHAEERRSVSKSIDAIFAPNYGVVVIMLLIVALGVFNAVFINVLFQIREFAVLRTVGLLTVQVRLMVICEALATGFIGLVFGLLTGLWVAVQSNLGLQELLGLIVGFHIPWLFIGALILFIPLISVLATFYPQRLACRLSISQTMESAERM